MEHDLTRRALLQAGAAAGALVGMESMLPGQVLEKVLAAPAACGTLADIEHVVIFINENRSFDSYFGSFHGARGFGDPSVARLHDGSNLPIFAQPFPGADASYGGHLLPFRFDTSRQGECVNDISHEWVAQHQSYNGGAMDQFVVARLAPNTPRDAINTMGYYTRSDLPFYYALADAFTLCDSYHCSVIGPTDPNRLYTISATLDPEGRNGGPILSTSTTRAERVGTLTWPTYPEQLQAHGISWKVYASADGDFGDNVLPYFRAYQQNPQLAANALTPTFPGQFQADCAAGTLPQVSWVLAPLVQSEHPPAPVTYGEAAAAQVLGALTSNPALWAKTALFVTYDENGGFFDHVPPPTAPPGTPGEYLTVNPLPADAGGIAGPVGLGFRVPMTVVSPFSRGGFVCSDRFDHTSILRFLETRFGVEVPNLSAWRRSITGDLTSAFNFAAPDASVPTLPMPSLADARVLTSNCSRNAPDSGSASFPTVAGYPPPPTPQAMPAQEPGAPRRPSGVCASRRGVAGSQGYERGTPRAGNPLGLPSTSGCKSTRRFAFLIAAPNGRRVRRVDVYINGHRVKTVRAVRGAGVTRIVLSDLPAGSFRMRVVAHTADGHEVQTVRTYHGCHRGAPHVGHRQTSAGVGSAPAARFTG